MDYRGQRPPRSARPPQAPQGPPSYQTQNPIDPPFTPPYPTPPENARGISFQNTERGDRQGPVEHPRHFSAYQPQLSPTQLDPSYAEAGGYADGRVGRKKSLVRPDREKIDPSHRQFHYRTHAAQLQEEGDGGFQPSCAYTRPTPNACFSDTSLFFLRLSSYGEPTPKA